MLAKVLPQNSHVAPGTDRHMKQLACRAARALLNPIHRGMQATIACQTSSSCFALMRPTVLMLLGSYDLLHMMWCSCVPQPQNALGTCSTMPHAQAMALTMHALFVISQTQPQLLPLPGRGQQNWFHRCHNTRVWIPDQRHRSALTNTP